MKRIDYSIKNRQKKDTELEKIFKNLLYEKEIYVSVYDFNDEISDLSELEQPTKVAKLNILSRDIWDYDTRLFGETEESDSYNRPRMYFCNYIIYMDKQSDRAAFYRLKEMQEDWFCASFLKGSNGTEYHGEIEHSGSPVVYYKRALYITDHRLSASKLNCINYKYSKGIKAPSTDLFVHSQLNAWLQDIHFTEAKIFRVGNANLINITGKNEKNGQKFEAIYDVGYHSKEYQDDIRIRYGCAVRRFKKITPDIVFLSHWDDDHIIGCVYADEKLFDCQWFAPEIEKQKSLGAKRLAKYLSVKKKLTIIKRNSINDRKVATVSGSNGEISFYLGQNVSKNGLSKENCGGLVIEIINKNPVDGNKVESLFCGDVPYKAIEKIIWSNRVIGYDNLVVPHHGSPMNYSPLKVKNGATAVICCNDNKKNTTNTSRRPAPAHVKVLNRFPRQIGYSVNLTEYAKGSFISLKLE